MILVIRFTIKKNLILEHLYYRLINSVNLCYNEKKVNNVKFSTNSTQEVSVAAMKSSEEKESYYSISREMGYYQNARNKI